MSCEVAALLFQANANYGTWSIDIEIGDHEPNLKLNLFISNTKLYDV